LFLLCALAGFSGGANAADQKTDAGQTEPSSVMTSPVAPAPQSNRIENSVVKIFSAVRLPDLGKPWTKQAPKDLTGSGVVIEGKRILTNAHVVLYAGQVQVQGNQSGDKISARVEAIAPGIDLAVLKLDDETFFDTRPPLPRANTLPAIKDAVMAYGFPTGGTSLSITKGIVSRIEFTAYSSFVAGLRIQIDAAINPGNSGGPAVVDDKMIGLANSRLVSAQNIGYIIPCEEIELFLQDIADGKYDGKPFLFDETPTIENAALRSYLRLSPTVEGVVVHKTDNPDPAYPLKKWDVITKIGDTPMDNQGKVKLGENLRVGFQYQIQKIAKNGRVPLTVLREGRELTIEVPLEYNRPKLIPYLNGDYPAYFVYGPMVFSVATEDFVAAITSGTAGSTGTSGTPSINGATVFNALSVLESPLVTRRSARPTVDEPQLVVIPAPFFPHKLAKGYSNPAGRVVKSVNGIPIKSLRHLVEVLRDAKEDSIVIEVSQRGAESLVFPRKDMVAATEEILNDNGIRAQGSPDMLEVWSAK
jgi:S1-C subfamily serine protease